MSWLIGSTLASIVAAFVVVRIFDYLLSGAAGGVANAARASLFVSAWTAVTTGAGMRAFSERMKQLRHRTGYTGDSGAPTADYERRRGRKF